LHQPIWYSQGLVPFPPIALDLNSDTPIYRQIADSFVSLIEKGLIDTGERLPATRELAGQLKLNRATVSAAYAVLEESGLIQGHVGRGSFVARRISQSAKDTSSARPSREVTVNFASSRPAAAAFPLTQFRRLSKAVIDSPETAEILQLGSPHGYGPLRRYLLHKEQAEGIARPEDDLMVTNGCQQALDLLARTTTVNGGTVLCEDPVYHGLLRVFSRAGAHIIPAPVGPAGLDLDAVEEVLTRQKPRLLVVTPSFQNPTGATIPLDARKRLVELAQKSGVILVENDIYSELRYLGDELPTLKQLDDSGKTVLLRSYSKVAFPGLRVGWVTAPREIIARLTEEKQISDLHSDQLAQAIFLRFAESGELAEHVKRTREAGRERLEAAFRACEACLPEGATYTRPEGGMCLWIELPAPLTAEAILRQARTEGVDFLPGSNFSLSSAHSRSLRISFGGLSPREITRGIQILGGIASAELATNRNTMYFEPAAALV
jgi:DNA-binding transcriptional MocR family regulator